jgi:hypothetical protein
MYRTSNANQEAICRIVQANDLNAVAGLELRCYKLAHCLWRAASRWRETTDDVKYEQRRPRCLW